MRKCYFIGTHFVKVRRAIKDNYPKYVISMTPLVTSNDDDGITHLHLRKFLKEGF